jgi:hypothetical protein
MMHHSPATFELNEFMSPQQVTHPAMTSNVLCRFHKQGVVIALVIG